MLLAYFKCDISEADFFLEFIWTSDDCNLSLETGTLWMNYYKKWRFWLFDGYEKYALL